MMNGTQGRMSFFHPPYIHPYNFKIGRFGAPRKDCLYPKQSSGLLKWVHIVWRAIRPSKRTLL